LKATNEFSRLNLGENPDDGLTREAETRVSAAQIAYLWRLGTNDKEQNFGLEERYGRRPPQDKLTTAVILVFFAFMSCSSLRDLLLQHLWLVPGIANGDRRP
jgi:hypothetical protein